MTSSTGTYLTRGTFWVPALERGVRAAAASLAGLLVGEQTAGAFDGDLSVTGLGYLVVAATAGVVSLLLSVAAGSTGTPGTPGFTPERPSTGEPPVLPRP